MDASHISSPKKVIFSTGNILSINDIKKKPTANPTEELTEVITFILKEHGSNVTPNGDALKSVNIISRNDDLHATIAENGLDDLKIGLKLFLTNDSHTMLNEAVENALSKHLKISQVDNIIIAFSGKQSSEQTNDDLNQIKNIWKSLEKYVGENVVKELGIADVEETTFRALHDWATVKPKIIQINLETCCVVPPTLQQFCKDNNIKLLTHSDSSDILPNDTLQEIFGTPMDLQWAVRFTVHIRCRGVLTTKGYVLCLNSA